jgi:hypothetical protein
MELSVMDRIVLQNLLPKEGNFANLKLLRKARESLSFTEDENKALAFRQEGDKLFWEDGFVGTKEIVIGEVVTQLIVKELKRLDESGKLQNEHLSVFEKFMSQ